MFPAGSLILQDHIVQANEISRSILGNQVIKAPPEVHVYAIPIGWHCPGTGAQKSLPLAVTCAIMRWLI